MITALQIRDTTTAGDCLHAFQLEVPTPTLTARELIRARVLEEWRQHHGRAPAAGRHRLVVPRGQQAVDGDAQVEVAHRAFAEQAFLLLVDDRQIESLDDVVEVGENTEVVFLKLVPLVGG